MVSEIATCFRPSLAPGAVLALKNLETLTQTLSVWSKGGHPQTLKGRQSANPNPYPQNCWTGKKMMFNFLFLYLISHGTESHDIQII